MMMKVKKMAYLAFLRLEKAYDRVDTEALWQEKEVYGIHGTFLPVIKSFYKK